MSSSSTIRIAARPRTRRPGGGRSSRARQVEQQQARVDEVERRQRQLGALEVQRADLQARRGSASSSGHVEVGGQTPALRVPPAPPASARTTRRRRPRPGTASQSPTPSAVGAPDALRVVARLEQLHAPPSSSTRSGRYTCSSDLPEGRRRSRANSAKSRGSRPSARRTPSREVGVAPVEGSRRTGAGEQSTRSGATPAPPAGPPTRRARSADVTDLAGRRPRRAPRPPRRT